MPLQGAPGQSVVCRSDFVHHSAAPDLLDQNLSAEAQNGGRRSAQRRRKGLLLLHNLQLVLPHFRPGLLVLGSVVYVVKLQQRQLREGNRPSGLR